MITVSAPGKLLLMGDHAVIYGQPCLVTAMDERLSVSLEKIPGTQTVIHAPQVTDTKFIDATLALARARFPASWPGLSITTQNGFSGIKGLGSSSAVVVAVWKALSIILNQPLTNSELFDCAYQTILTVQGVGSGFDVAAAIYGGVITFTVGGKTITPLTVPTVPIVVGYTGIAADTPTIVREVAQKYEREPGKLEKIFAAIGGLVEQAESKIVAGDWERVGTLMNFNQDYLRDLGVSSPQLEDLIGAAKQAGAYGAKLSGAGRGDCMIAVVDQPHRSAVEAAIVAAGGKIVTVHPNAPGVRVETTDNQTELFVVVDKDDRILEYRTRYDCHHDKTLIHRGVNALLFDDQGRVLLQKRSLTKDTSPGLWSTSVGGHVGKDETYEAAVTRELQEELGVSVPLVAAHKFLFSYPHETEIETLFTGQSNGPFHPQPEEVAQVSFISKNELPRKLLSGEIQLTQLADHALRLVGFL